MVEEEIVKLLNANGVKAFMERPQKAMSEYVVVEKTGSTSNDWLTTSTLAVQSVSTSLAKAAKLNEKVKKIMLQADIKSISAIRLISDYNFTNMVTKQYRYQAVYTCTGREIGE